MPQEPQSKAGSTSSFLLAREGQGAEEDAQKGTDHHCEVSHVPALVSDASYDDLGKERVTDEIAGEADRIAQQRYNTNMETFLIGKISTLDLNDAQVSKDQARRSHIYELQNYWYYYYKIRSITLWDFNNNCDIDADFDKLMEQ